MSARESAVLARQIGTMMKGEESEVTFSAALTDEQVEEMDRVTGDSSKVGVSRRLALIAQARDSASLLKLAREEPETFNAILKNVHHFAEHA
jgi:hypothetical protein